MLKAGDLAGLLAQRVFTTTKAPLLPPGASTTPAPTRFFPKGQIKLDRFPTGSTLSQIKAGQSNSI